MNIDLEVWKDMWTSKKYDYWLINTYGDYSIYHLPTNSDITIENDEVYLAVIEKMLKHNVKQVGIEEYNDYLRSQLDPEYSDHWDET